MLLTSQCGFALCQKVMNLTALNVIFKTRVHDKIIGGDNPFRWQDVSTDDIGGKEFDRAVWKPLFAGVIVSIKKSTSVFWVRFDCSLSGATPGSRPLLPPRSFPAIGGLQLETSRIQGAQIRDAGSRPQGCNYCQPPGRTWSRILSIRRRAGKPPTRRELSPGFV